MTSTRRLTTEEIKPLIGSRVLADKAALLSGEHAAEIRELLEERSVLVFPKISFSDEEQLAFTATLGTIGHERSGEELTTISLDPAKSSAVEYLKGSFYWHFDGTMQDKPIFASLLSAKVMPPEGGSTEFANTYAAYEALSAEEKQRFDGMTAMHSAWNTLFYYDPEPSTEKLEMFMAAGDVELPLVWTHKSGRKSLVLGRTARHIVGMDFRESARLLNRLREFATSEPFHYAHHWTVGDMVMWDNTGTLHRAMPYDATSVRE
ncbi:MAG TPA: TauD/TfdA family dioxygenase, partial [Novosphingobium sp.]|nr:TauD/TfdA family dioxygenase [Novosphingobium sp.]